MSINCIRQTIEHFNEHEVSFAMIKILEEQHITNEDLRTMDRDDVEHLFQNRNGFTFRDRKQFWHAIQKIKASTIKTNVIYLEQHNSIPNVYNPTNNHSLPPLYIPQVSPDLPVKVSKTTKIDTESNIVELSSSEEENDSVKTPIVSLPVSIEVIQSNEILKENFVFPVKLPIFSTRITRALETNNIKSEWSTFVNELAVWIFNTKQTNLTKTEYQAIGKTVYKMYPCTGKDGYRPWSQLCRCLTQRLRKIKARQLRKVNQ